VACLDNFGLKMAFVFGLTRLGCKEDVSEAVFDTSLMLGCVAGFLGLDFEAFMQLEAFVDTWCI